jgi:hypothetical protein
MNATQTKEAVMVRLFGHGTANVLGQDGWTVREIISVTRFRGGFEVVFAGGAEGWFHPDNIRDVRWAD